MGVVGFIRGRWVHPESQGSLGLELGVVGFIWCRWVNSGARWGSLGYSVVVRYSEVHNGRSFVQPGSLGSLGFALGIFGFIQIR